MQRYVRRWITLGAVSLSVALGSVTTAGASDGGGCATVMPQIVSGTFDFTFSAGQYPLCFRDILRGPDINDGLDLGGTDNTALNLTGGAGPGGGSWLTVVDPVPATSGP